MCTNHGHLYNNRHRDVSCEVFTPRVNQISPALMQIFPNGKRHFDSFMECVVPENIHTPTTEGIGNSEGEGGSKTQEIPGGRGVV